MQPCPRCEGTQAWRLGDGRWKCRACRRRFSITSAWESVRLPELVKEHLLRQFAAGVPSYRGRERAAASSKSRERFNRLARACCAQAEGLGQPRGQALRWPADPSHTIFVTLRLFGRRVRFACPASRPGAAVLRRLERLAPGRLTRGSARSAFGLLPVRGGRVIVRLPAPDVRAKAQAAARIEAFWRFALDGLRPYGTLPLRYFHLYLAEACFRYNRGSANLSSELGRLMRATPAADLRDQVRLAGAPKRAHARYHSPPNGASRHTRRGAAFAKPTRTGGAENNGE